MTTTKKSKKTTKKSKKTTMNTTTKKTTKPLLMPGYCPMESFEYDQAYFEQDGELMHDFREDMVF